MQEVYGIMRRMYTYMHGFSPLYSPFAPALMLAIFPFIALAAIWTIAIKGYALWHAARNGQKEWFIALLVVNTLGILEIVYLVWFRPDSSGVSHPPARPAHPPARDSSAQA